MGSDDRLRGDEANLQGDKDGRHRRKLAD